MNTFDHIAKYIAKTYDTLREGISVTMTGVTVVSGNISTTELNSGAILTATQGINAAVDANTNMKSQLYIMKDGTPTLVSLDTVSPGTAPGHIPIPVVITDVNGMAVVNITAGDINVKIVHDGTDPSSIRMGDGTTLVGVTTSNEMKVSDATTHLGIWDFITGNSKVLAFYAGVEAGNPSGATTNLKTIIYKTGITTILTRTFAWTAGDALLSITAS